MYRKSLFYAISMVLCSVLTYLFLDSGFNTKTKNFVNYENNSKVYYNVSYFDGNYERNSNRFISNMVDYIDINYEYNNVFSEYVSGYYKYSVDSYLIAYDNNMDDSLWKKEYNLIGEKFKLLNEGNVNNIKITDSFRVDYKKYRDEILKIINDEDIELSGYLQVKIKILEFLSFDGFKREFSDNKVITLNIPLTDSTFKIDVNDIENHDSYYEYSDSKMMNMVFVMIGLFCFSLSLSFFAMIIRQFVLIYKKESSYNKNLRRILSKYDNIIVRSKKLFVSKRYNMIYVDSFKELLDVYNNVNKMINFKEVKRGSKSIFLIINEDNAWIYELVSDCVNNKRSVDINEK